MIIKAVEEIKRFDVSSEPTFQPAKPSLDTRGTSNEINIRISDKKFGVIH